MGICQDVAMIVTRGGSTENVFLKSPKNLSVKYKAEVSVIGYGSV